MNPRREHGRQIKEGLCENLSKPAKSNISIMDTSVNEMLEWVKGDGIGGMEQLIEAILMEIPRGSVGLGFKGNNGKRAARGDSIIRRRTVPNNHIVITMVGRV
ncbi:hypothetical protein MLD38_029518 [Melastoma candidum]|uniref:Uncharacterized protein n=1 Tax=Melastoma candidum TaxID=119954 RepID=A0ACB9N9Q6_9MYRT|nr:hypothetical protein MLD38_029518 [Melastoma candidum]